MGDNLQFTCDFFKTSGIVPITAKTLDLNTISCITLQEFLQLSEKEQETCKKIITCENPEIVMDCAGSVISINKSCEGCRVAANRTSAVAFIISADANGHYHRIPSQTIMLTSSAKSKNKIKRDEQSQRKGVSKMAKDITKQLKSKMSAGEPVVNNNISADAESAAKKLDSLISAKGNPAGTGEISPSNEFKTDNSDAAKAAKKEQQEAIKNALTQSTQGVDLGDLTLLHSFNRDNGGRLISFVTPAESKVTLSVVKQYVLDNEGHRVLTGASEEAQQDYINSGYKTSSVDAKLFATKNNLQMKQSAPSALTGAIFSIPAGGLVPPAKLYTGGIIEPNETDTTKIIKVMPKDLAFTFIRQYFGSSIMESEDILGASAKTVHIKRTQKMVEGSTKIKDAFVVDGRRVLVPGNYLPCKVWLSKPLSEVMSLNAKEKSAMIKGFAGNIFKGTTAKPTPKYDTLDAESKNWFTKNEDGTYTSDVFSGKVQVEVKAFDDKKKVVANPEIPVKLFSMTTTGKERGAFVCYNVLKPENYAKDYPELYTAVAPLNPATNPKYAKIVAALGETTVQQVMEICCKKPKTSNGRGGVVEVNYMDALKQDRNQAQNRITNVQGLTFTADANERYQKLIANAI